MSADRYCDVDVVVDGSLIEHEVFATQAELDAYIENEKRAARSDGMQTQVWVLWHEHAAHDGVCPCAQLEGDGRPAYTFGDDRHCPECGADILGNDPHGPGCPSEPAVAERRAQRVENARRWGGIA